MNFYVGCSCHCGRCQKLIDQIFFFTISEVNKNIYSSYFSDFKNPFIIVCNSKIFLYIVYEKVYMRGQSKWFAEFHLNFEFNKS